jgi:adenylate cyclase
MAQMSLGSLLNFARRFDEAATQLEHAIALDQNLSSAYVLLGFSDLGRAQATRAVQHLEKARVLAHARPDVVALHGHALARAGRRGDALRALNELHRLAEPAPPSPFLVAMVHIGLGDRDRAFAFLDQAVRERSWQLPMIKADHNFDVLRSDPRFPELLARLNLPR